MTRQVIELELGLEFVSGLASSRARARTEPKGELKLRENSNYGSNKTQTPNQNSNYCSNQTQTSNSD